MFIPHIHFYDVIFREKGEECVVMIIFSDICKKRKSERARRG